jgi:hypothetical protein
MNPDNEIVLVRALQEIAKQLKQISQSLSTLPQLLAQMAQSRK